MLLLMKSGAIRNRSVASPYDSINYQRPCRLFDFFLSFTVWSLRLLTASVSVFTFPYVVVSSVARNLLILFLPFRPSQNFLPLPESFINFLIFNFVPRVK